VITTNNCLTRLLMSTMTTSGLCIRLNKLPPKAGTDEKIVLKRQTDMPKLALPTHPSPTTSQVMDESSSSDKKAAQIDSMTSAMGGDSTDKHPQEESFGAPWLYKKAKDHNLPCRDTPDDTPLPVLAFCPGRRVRRCLYSIKYTRGNRSFCAYVDQTPPDGMRLRGFIPVLIKIPPCLQGFMIAFLDIRVKNRTS
jgi:hypothetical protein